MDKRLAAVFNLKLLALFVSFLLCVLLAAVVHLLYNIDIVYTHLFYIPIIIAGIWYPAYAVPLAFALGIVHMGCDYAALGDINASAVLRAAVFLAVASITSRLALKRDYLLRELQMLNSAMLDMISRINHEGIIEYVSPSVSNVLGFAPEDLMGKPFCAFIHPDDIISVRQAYKEAIKNQAPFRADYRQRCANGGYVWIETLASPLPGQHQGIKIFVFGSRDIASRKKAEEALTHLTIHDALTGLHNRLMFDEERRRFASGRFDPVGIIMCDIDGLKLVNDHLGHEAGDKLIMASAKLLRDVFRASDMVARIGGDEFVVMLANCPPERVRKFSADIRQALAGQCVPGTDIPLMMSVGYAARDGEDVSVDDLIREADMDMYRHKSLNRENFKASFEAVLTKS